MGSGQGAQAGRRRLSRLAAIGIAAALLASLSARGHAGQAAWPESEFDLMAHPERSLELLAEVSILAVLAADRLSRYPDVQRIREGSPKLMLGRAGLSGRLARWDVDALLRVDFSEAARIHRRDATERPFAALGRALDDAAIRWWPRREIGVVAGRQTPPFSRFRQIERGDLLGSAPPFFAGRAAPERRWGAAAIGEWGQLAYAAGLYADGEGLELRRPVRDPSRGGVALASARVTWAIRGPGGQPTRPFARDVPGHEQWRIEAGLGGLWRIRERGDRASAAASAHVAYRRLAGAVELIAHAEPSLRALGASGELGFLAGDNLVFELRGDVDPELGLWSAGAGATYFAAATRRSGIGLYGFARRPVGGGPPRDGLLLELRASL